MVQAPQPNTGRREKLRKNDLFFWGGGKNYLKKIFFFCKILQNIGGNKFSRAGYSPKWVKSKRRRKKERKKDRTMVITMAKLRITHAWRTQAAWAKITFLIEEKICFYSHYLLFILDTYNDQRQFA